MWRAITRGVQSGVRVLRNMPSNVEIKAKLADREKAIRVAKELSASEGPCTHNFHLCMQLPDTKVWERVYSYFSLAGTTLDQEDTFFTVPNGRLKVILPLY